MGKRIGPVGLGQHNLFVDLKRIGYIPGLTMQTIPYNWYYGLFHNEVNRAF